MIEPIRVLCVFGCLDRGGAETMCMNLYRNIDRSKVQFDFVTHSAKPCAYDEEIRSLGGRIFVAPRFQAWNIQQYTSWWKRHLSQHPEHKIIHGHMFTVAPIYFHVAHKAGRVTIGHSHSSEPLEKKTLKSEFKRVLKTRMEAESDYCLACSEQAGAYLFPNKEYYVLNNAIDSAQFAFDAAARSAVRSEFGLTEDNILLCVVGSLISVKNPFGTIEIFQQYHARNPETKLLWCGMGNLHDEVQKRIHDCGLEKEILLAGVRSDIPKVLQAADVYLMPSLYEGLPVSAIEAQAAGLPCILSDRISRETAITDRCSFVPLENTAAWIEAIEEGIQKGRSDTMQQIIDAGYDIHTTAKWLQDFYLKIAPKT